MLGSDLPEAGAHVGESAFSTPAQAMGTAADTNVNATSM